MEDASTEQPVEPVGHVRIVYLGPVAPHWEVQSDFGAPEVIDAFRDRALARLVLLPPHDPQFRRNRERVIRDAERENITLEWDLGFPEETETPVEPAAAPAAAGPATTGPAAAEPAAEPAAAGPATTGPAAADR